ADQRGARAPELRLGTAASPQLGDQPPRCPVGGGGLDRRADPPGGGPQQVPVERLCGPRLGLLDDLVAELIEAREGASARPLRRAAGFPPLRPAAPGRNAGGPSGAILT